MIDTMQLAMGLLNYHMLVMGILGKKKKNLLVKSPEVVSATRKK